MKCRNCNNDSMVCVDDNGSVGGGIWEHCICSICLTEHDYTKQGNTIKEKWLLQNNFVVRTETELRMLYSESISKED